MDARPVSFPAARYRFDCVADTPVRLPEYAGSVLRGAFGHALKKTVCITRQSDCHTCALYRSCAYPAVFKPPAPATHSVQKFADIPAPYVIEPPAWGEKHHASGDTFSFHFVLIGQALKHLPLILHAWQRALASGIGPGDGSARLHSVHHCQPDHDACIYRSDDGEVLPHHAVLPPAPPVHGSVTLRFATQVRLQHEGKPLRPHTITAQRLLIGVVKRSALISEFHAGHKHTLGYYELGQQAGQIDARHDLQWRDWTRYSSRQKQEMSLGGVIGTWQLSGDLAPFWPHLHLGQWLHVGKNATFGLGHYTLEAAGADANAL